MQAKTNHCRHCGIAVMRKNGGTRAACDSCKMRNKVKWRATHPDRLDQIMFKSNMKRSFGITPEAYEAMFEKQFRKCAICGTSPVAQRFPVDHDHQTGRIRGILCGSCNRGLGLLGDDPSRLRAALSYLEAVQ